MLCIVAVERFCVLIVDEHRIAGLLEANSNCLEADSWPTCSSIVWHIAIRCSSSSVEELKEIVYGVLVKLMQVPVPNVSCLMVVVNTISSMRKVAWRVALVGVE
jgi:hypothetical protein